jgi:hypothetical protein
MSQLCTSRPRAPSHAWWPVFFPNTTVCLPLKESPEQTSFLSFPFLEFLLLCNSQESAQVRKPSSVNFHSVNDPYECNWHPSQVAEPGCSEESLASLGTSAILQPEICQGLTFSITDWLCPVRQTLNNGVIQYTLFCHLTAFTPHCVTGSHHCCVFTAACHHPAGHGPL